MIVFLMRKSEFFIDFHFDCFLYFRIFSLVLSCDNIIFLDSLVIFFDGDQGGAKLHFYFWSAFYFVDFPEL
jgi:hypothetical protein